MKFIESVKKMLPGCAIALVIAVVAKFLEQLEESVGLHLIGASVIAMFIGMIVNRFYAPNDKTKPGIKFTSKKILKFAIILLGASLNITTVLTVGKFSLTVMLFTLATCFGLGYVIGKALGLDWKTSSLINAGTGICGGSAIAAIAPVIEATDMDIAYGMSATFLFDTIMVVVFPLLGRAMSLSDAAFGLWAGTAVNDTSSVVATGYAFSEGAGDLRHFLLQHARGHLLSRARRAAWLLDHERRGVRHLRRHGHQRHVVRHGCGLHVGLALRARQPDARQGRDR